MAVLREAETVSKKTPARQKSVQTTTPLVAPVVRGQAPIPALLLEGDELTAEHLKTAGPSAETPAPASPSLPFELDLPKAGGAGLVRLTPRDPRCLYANWDFTNEQQRQFNRISAEGHLVLRLHRIAEGETVPSDLPLHPDSTHWFIPLEPGGGRYRAELGYHRPDREWVKVAASGVVEIHPEKVEKSMPVQFATLSLESRPEAAAAIPGGEPAAEMRAAGSEPGPKASPISGSGGRLRWAPVPEWSVAQEQAMAQLIASAFVREETIGSLELAEWVSGRLRGRAERPAIPEFPEWQAAEGPEGIPGPGDERGQGITSPTGGEQPRPQGFWFTVNAELVVYGATEPDACVTIAGRRIQLRPDGSFSYRFALPDGDYRLPVAAQSARGDWREADLRFRRKTTRTGEVGVQSPDATLNEPPTEDRG